jgi:hypothetical protein
MTLGRRIEHQLPTWFFIACILLGRPAMVVADMATPTPTACQSEAGRLQFVLAAEPAAPRVGDEVTLTVTAYPTDFVGEPEYRLTGTEPCLEGDTSPVVHYRQVIGSDVVTYKLRAVQVGTVSIRMSANFETNLGCERNPIWMWWSSTSDPFALTIGEGQPITPGTSTPTATPTPTRTVPQPPPVDGQVLTTGAEGLIGASLVPVEMWSCYGSLATCEGDGLFQEDQTITDSDGYFELRLSSYSPPGLLVVAEVDGTRLRNIAPYEWYTYIVVDPMTEAAVRILSDRGLERYDPDGVAAVVEAVRAANANTAFGGLSLSAAVELAVIIALDDPEVTRALVENILPPTWTPSPVTPSPTRTRTATPTETPTRRVTATPRPCLGDCRGDGSVTIDELILAINIALDALPLAECLAYPDIPRISDLVKAVNNALDGCAPVAPLPDLVSTGWRSLDHPACGVRPTATLIICVANVGDGHAGRFVVSVDGLETSDIVIEGLEAGEEQCGATDWPSQESSVVVLVDATDAVEESREDNNAETYVIPTPFPTPPITCTMKPTPTATRSLTPTGGPTPTATRSPTPTGTHASLSRCEVLLERIPL